MGEGADCNVESVTGRCSRSAVARAVVDADRGSRICSHSAGPGRITAAARGPSLRLSEGPTHCGCTDTNGI